MQLSINQHIYIARTNIDLSACVGFFALRYVYLSIIALMLSDLISGFGIQKQRQKVVNI
jgi:hypothetical protein